MKNTKKLLISVLTVALSLIILVGCIFTASAEGTITFSPEVTAIYEAQKYGSFDKGVTPDPTITHFYKFYPSVQYGNPTIQGHPNLNFEKGWEYWIHTDNFKMNSETDKDGKKNTFVTVATDIGYKGIYSVKFSDNRIKPDDSIAVLYKWRNVSHANDCEPKLIQLYNNYYDESKDGENTTTHPQHQLVHYSAAGIGDKVIWRADDDDDKEWHISLTHVYHNTKEAVGENPISYYYLGLQTRINPEIFNGTDLDDVQLVKVDSTTGLVHDLDGNQLYNLNALPTRNDPDYIWGDLAEKDPNAKIKVNVEDLLSGKIDLSDAVGSDDDTPTSEGVALWVWIVIAAGAILLIAVVAVIIIIVTKKKKAAVPAEESEEAPAEVAQEETAEEATEETTTED